MSWTDYITSDNSTPSRSGLYANNLPGVTLNLFNDLTKDEQADFKECWSDLYLLAQANFISDIQGQLSDKFHIDLKLATRETSLFEKGENTNHGLAGIKLSYYMPKYAKIQILNIEVFSLANYLSPEFQIKIYDTDENGELLYTGNFDVTIGRNTLPIYQDFEVDNLYVTYSSTNYRLYKTENRYYATCRYRFFDKMACAFPCWGDGYETTVIHVNGGGLNVKTVIYCSIEKFILENLNIFKTAFFNRIGIEIMRERILTDRFNRFTTLTVDRAKELMGYYDEEYQKHLTNSIKNLKVQEDDICFDCKSSVSTSQLLP